MGQMFRAFSPADGNGRVIPREDGDTVILDYDPEDGIMVPRPGRVQPKPGNWRVTPGAKVRIPGVKSTTMDHNLNANRTEGDYVGERLRFKRRRRERQLAMLVELVELGVVSRDDLSPRELAALA